MKLTVFEAMMQMSDLYAAQAVAHSSAALVCLELSERTKEDAMNLPIEEGSQFIEVEE